MLVDKCIWCIDFGLFYPALCYRSYTNKTHLRGLNGLFLGVCKLPKFSVSLPLRSLRLCGFFNPYPAPRDWAAFTMTGEAN